MKERLLNLLVDSLDEIIYEINISSKAIKWHNNILKKLHYLDFENLSNLDNFILLIHPEDREKYNKKIKEKENNKIIYRIKDAFNIYHTWEDTSIYHKDEKEEIFISICKDISKEKKISQDLLIVKKTNEDILDNTNDLFFYKDLEFNYIGCNKAFCEFVGKPKEEILGKNDFELFNDSLAKLFRTMDLKMLETKKTKTNKEYVTYPNGKEVLLLTQKSPLLDKNNNIYGILGISRDITLEMNYKKS